MARVTRVSKARIDQGTCDKCGKPIQRGDPYIWYKFRYGPKRKRCSGEECYPRRSELTQSAFFSELWDIQDTLAEIEDKEQLEELLDRIRDLGDEQQTSLDNMPDGLQEGDTGQLLQERIDSCEQWVGDLECEEFPEREDFSSDEDYEDAIESWKDTVRSTDYQGE